MRILYVVNKFPKLSESFILNEIYALSERGHDVSVFSIRHPDEEISHSEVDELDLTVHYMKQPHLGSVIDLFDSRVLNPRVLRNAMFLDDPIHHSYWLYIGLRTIEFIDQIGGVDHIHAHFASSNRLGVTYAASYHEIPCTITAHAYEIFSDVNRRRLRRVCSCFDHIIVPSEYNREYLIDEFGVDNEISVIPASTRADKFEPSDDYVPGRILTVARLVEKKGHEYALEAVARLLREGYDVTYHLIGSGPREAFLRDRVRQLGIEGSVEFLGNVPDDDLKSELQEAALFVLPCVIASGGDRDVAPVALKEAMATQTACISTHISAIPEMITDGYDGVLVEPHNSDELVRAMRMLLDDPSRRNEIAANARNTIVERYGISKTIESLIETFRETRHKRRASAELTTRHTAHR